MPLREDSSDCVGGIFLAAVRHSRGGRWSAFRLNATRSFRATFRSVIRSFVIGSGCVRGEYNLWVTDGVMDVRAARMAATQSVITVS